MSTAGSGESAAYWRANLRILAALLSVWALVSFGCGIVFADALNSIRIPGTGFGLGFWFAQQGAIYVFVVLIFVYAWALNRLDRRYGVDETDAVAQSGESAHASSESESGPRA